MDSNYINFDRDDKLYYDELGNDRNENNFLYRIYEDIGGLDLSHIHRQDVNIDETHEARKTLGEIAKLDPREEDRIIRSIRNTVDIDVTANADDQNENQEHGFFKTILGHLHQATTYESPDFKNEDVENDVDLTGKRVLDRYQVYALLKTGGHGRVYAGYDVFMKIPVSIKVTTSEMFSRGEIKLLPKVAATTSYVPRVIDFGIYTDTDVPSSEVYFVIILQLLPGRPLRSFLDTWIQEAFELRASEAIQIILDVVKAVQACHKQGIVHFDIHPGNILIDKVSETEESILSSDRPKKWKVWLIDFGLATAEASDLPKDYNPVYCSPEVTVRSRNRPHELDDLFSIAAVLYEIVTQGITDDMDPPNYISSPDFQMQHRLKSKEIPDGLRSFLKKALDRDIENRHQSTEEMLDELGKVYTEVLKQERVDKSGNELERTLFDAVEKWDMDRLRDLVESNQGKGKNISTIRDRFGNTLLHHIAKSCCCLSGDHLADDLSISTSPREEIVRYLIEEVKIDVNAKNNDEETCLYLASQMMRCYAANHTNHFTTGENLCIRSAVAVIETFLKHGADTMIREKRKRRTALHVAYCKDVADALLEGGMGSDRSDATGSHNTKLIEMRDSQGHTPLMTALCSQPHIYYRIELARHLVFKYDANLIVGSISGADKSLSSGSKGNSDDGSSGGSSGSSGGGGEEDESSVSPIVKLIHDASAPDDLITNERGAHSADLLMRIVLSLTEIKEDLGHSYEDSIRRILELDAYIESSDTNVVTLRLWRVREHLLKGLPQWVHHMTYNSVNALLVGLLESHRAHYDRNHIQYLERSLGAAASLTAPSSAAALEAYLTDQDDKCMVMDMMKRKTTQHVDSSHHNHPMVFMVGGVPLGQQSSDPEQQQEVNEEEKKQNPIHMIGSLHGHSTDHHHRDGNANTVSPSHTSHSDPNASHEAVHAQEVEMDEYEKCNEFECWWRIHCSSIAYDSDLSVNVRNALPCEELVSRLVSRFPISIQSLRGIVVDIISSNQKEVTLKDMKTFMDRFGSFDRCFLNICDTSGNLCAWYHANKDDPPIVLSKQWKSYYIRHSRRQENALTLVYASEGTDGSIVMTKKRVTNVNGYFVCKLLFGDKKFSDLHELLLGVRQMMGSSMEIVPSDLYQRLQDGGYSRMEDMFHTFDREKYAISSYMEMGSKPSTVVLSIFFRLLIRLRALRLKYDRNSFSDVIGNTLAINKKKKKSVSGSGAPTGGDDGNSGTSKTIKRISKVDTGPAALSRTTANQRRKMWLALLAEENVSHYTDMLHVAIRSTLTTNHWLIRFLLDLARPEELKDDQLLSHSCSRLRYHIVQKLISRSPKTVIGPSGSLSTSIHAAVKAPFVLFGACHTSFEMHIQHKKDGECMLFRMHTIVKELLRLSSAHNNRESNKSLVNSLAICKPLTSNNRENLSVIQVLLRGFLKNYPEIASQPPSSSTTRLGHHHLSIVRDVVMLLLLHGASTHSFDRRDRRIFKNILNTQMFLSEWKQLEMVNKSALTKSEALNTIGLTSSTSNNKLHIRADTNTAATANNNNNNNNSIINNNNNNIRRGTALLSGRRRTSNILTGARKGEKQSLFLFDRDKLRNDMLIKSKNTIEFSDFIISTDNLDLKYWLLIHNPKMKDLNLDQLLESLFEQDRNDPLHMIEQSLSEALLSVTERGDYEAFKRIHKWTKQYKLPMYGSMRRCNVDGNSYSILHECIKCRHTSIEFWRELVEVGGDLLKEEKSLIFFDSTSTIGTMDDISVIMQACAYARLPIGISLVEDYAVNINKTSTTHLTSALHVACIALRDECIREQKEAEKEEEEEDDDDEEEEEEEKEEMSMQSHNRNMSIDVSRDSERSRDSGHGAGAGGTGTGGNSVTSGRSMLLPTQATKKGEAIRTIRYLVSQGANCNLENHKQITPLSILLQIPVQSLQRDKDVYLIIETLLDHGAQLHRRLLGKHERLLLRGAYHLVSGLLEKDEGEASMDLRASSHHHHHHSNRDSQSVGLTQGDPNTNSHENRGNEDSNDSGHANGSAGSNNSNKKNHHKNNSSNHNNNGNGLNQPHPMLLNAASAASTRSGDPRHMKKENNNNNNGDNNNENGSGLDDGVLTDGARASDSLTNNRNGKQEDDGNGCFSHFIRHKQRHGKQRMRLTDPENPHFKGKFFQKAVNTEWEGTVRTWLITQFTLYSIFMCAIVLSSLVWGHGLYPRESYFLTDTLKRVYVDEVIDYTISGEFGKTYNNMYNLEEVWMWVEGPLINGVYDSSNRWRNSSGSVIPVSESLYINTYNRLITPVNLRQTRIEAETCEWSRYQSGFSSPCFPPFNSDDGIKANLSLPSSPELISSDVRSTVEGAFVYSEHISESVEGIFSTYPAGGYSVDLPRNITQAKEIIDALKQNNWLDLHSRSLMVEFTTHNPELDILCLVRFTIEQSSAGSISTFYEFETFKTLGGLLQESPSLFILQGIIVIFLCFYIFLEVIEIMTKPLFTPVICCKRMYINTYFTSIFNYVDWFLYISLSILMGLRFSLYGKLQDLDDELSSYTLTSDARANFEYLSDELQTEKYLTGIVFFVVCTKVVQYLRCSQNVSLFLLMLSSMVVEYLKYLGFLLVVVLGFTATVFLIFGSGNEANRHYGYSFFSTIQSTLRSSDKSKPPISDQYNVIGPVYVTFFNLGVALLLINLLIATLNDAYAEVRERNGPSRWCYEQFRMIKRFNSMFRRNQMANKTSGNQNALLNGGKDNDGGGVDRKKTMKKKNAKRTRTRDSHGSRSKGSIILGKLHSRHSMAESDIRSRFGSRSQLVTSMGTRSSIDTSVPSTANARTLSLPGRVIT